MRNNLIVKNAADYKDGGGITCSSSPVLIANNVIYKNSLSGWPVASSSGVYILGDVIPAIKNNIIAENSNGGIYYEGNQVLSPSYNDVFNNYHDYIGCSPGEGSLSSQPVFVAPDTDYNPYNDDYRLRTNSPCIDAGDPDPQFNDLDSSRNDMGLYGGPFAKNWFTKLADLNNNGKVDFIDYAVFAENWLMQGQHLEGDINSNGIVDIVDLRLLVLCWLESDI